MARNSNRLIAILLAASVAVAVATAVRIVTLPQSGSVRHAAGATGSALDDLRRSFNALGIQQTDGAIQHLLTSSGGALSFRGATYWTSADVSSRRDTYVAAGSLLSLVLILVAAVLVWLGRRQAPSGRRESATQRPAA